MTKDLEKPYWNSAVITMPDQSMRVYRWRGKTGSGHPTILESLDATTNEWLPCFDEKIFDKIAQKK